MQVCTLPLVPGASLFVVSKIRSYWFPSITWESILKISIPGYCQFDNGTVINEGIAGYYWGSTASSKYINYLFIDDDNAHTMNRWYRANGFTVRCIKN